MKKGTAITFAVGVFAGMTLCGPAAQAATTLTATLSDCQRRCDFVIFRRTGTVRK